MSKNKGKRWDGKSRVSNDLYRKNFDEIFKKMKDDDGEKYIHGEDEEDYLEELKNKL